MVLPSTERNRGYLGSAPLSQTSKFMVIDSEIQEIHTVVVYRFSTRDMDDPAVFAAQSIIRWQESDQGKWVFEHAIETPEWHKRDDPMSFSTDFMVTAKIKDRDYIVWLLKYGENR